MTTQQDRQLNKSKLEFPALNETDATTSRQVQREAAGNTLHPGPTRPEDLVPSRYALRVGEIDVLVVSDGVLLMPSPALATNADPAVRAAWLNDMFLPPDKMSLPLNQVVVRRG